MEFYRASCFLIVKRRASSPKNCFVNTIVLGRLCGSIRLDKRWYMNERQTYGCHRSDEHARLPFYEQKSRRWMRRKNV